MAQSFEKIFVEQCAPTLAGIKPANLFRFHPAAREAMQDTLCYWNQQLSWKGIGFYSLKKCHQTNSYLIVAYRPDWIMQMMSQKETQDFLKPYGYGRYDCCDSVWAHLSTRLSAEAEFPHEVGVFLGYPLCDVIGFIENRGKNYTCSGCWKAYGDPVMAQKQFGILQTCTAIYKNMHASGIPVVQLTMSAHI